MRQEQFDQVEPTQHAPQAMQLSLFDERQVLVASGPCEQADSVHNAAEQAMSEADRHMQAAWRLSNALRGRSPAAAKVRRLKPRQKHQLGSIICSHLLASLRAQADIERQQQIPH